MKIRVNFFDYFYLNSSDDANGNGIPDAEEGVQHGYDIANQMMGEDAVDQFQNANPEEADRIAGNLALFQAQTGYSADEMKEYAQNNANWVEQLDAYVAAQSQPEPTPEPTPSPVPTSYEAPEPEPTPYVAPIPVEADPIVNHNLNQAYTQIVEDNGGAQIWGNEIGQEAVVQQYSTNQSQAQSVVHGTNLAVEIFGEQAVTDAIHADSSGAATLAENLAKFQEQSGWTTDQMQTYISQNENWQSDLQSAVDQNEGAGTAVVSGTLTGAVGAGVAQGLVQGAVEGALTGAAGGVGGSVVDGLSVSLFSRNDGGQIWGNELGSDVVIQQYQQNQDQTEAVLHGTNLAVQIFGRDAVEGSVHADPSGAATLAENLSKFQEQSGWSTDQMHDYILNNPNWESDLNQAVNPDQAVMGANLVAGAIGGLASANSDSSGSMAGNLVQGAGSALLAGATEGAQLITSADQQKINTLLEENPDWKQKDVDDYIKANPTTWKQDLGQMFQATLVTRDADLSPEAANLVRDVMVSHPDMSRSDAQALVRVIDANPNLKVEDIRSFIVANPNNWEDTLYQADKANTIANSANLSADDRQQIQALMISHSDMSEADAAKMATLLKANPTWKTEDIDSYIKANADWKTDLNQLATANTVLNSTAAKDLTTAEKALVTNVLVDHPNMSKAQADALVRVIEANPNMKADDISAYITANPTSWETTLGKFDTAARVAKENNMDVEATEQLGRFLVNNPTVTTAQVNDYIKNNPNTWAADLEAMDVAKAKGLSAEDTDKLVKLSRSENALGEIDLEKFMSQPDWQKRLSQVDVSTTLADKYKMNPNESAQLQRVLADNPNMTAADVDNYIKENPNTWKKDLGNFDLAFNKLDLNADETGALVRLMQKDPTWTEAKVAALKAANPDDWKETIQLEDFAKSKNMTAAEKAQLLNVMDANQGFTMKDVQDYIAAKPNTWKQDLVNMDLSVKLADKLDLSDEQKEQLRTAMVNHTNFTAAGMENLFTTDRAKFDKLLTQSALVDKLGLDTNQTGALGKILEAHPEWKEADIQNYINANPDSWKVDLYQAGYASNLSLKYKLNDEQEGLLTHLMMANPRLNPTDIEAQMKDHPEQFAALLTSVKNGNQIADANNFTQDQREQLTRLMSQNPGLTTDVVNQYIAGNKDSWSTALKQIDGAYTVAAALHLTTEERDVVQQLMMLDPRSSANGIANYINNHKDDWATDFQQMAIVSANKMSQYEGDQLKAVMTGMPEWTPAKVNEYIAAHPDTWKADLKSAYTANGAEIIATANNLSDADKALALEWMNTNQRMTPDQLTNFIKDHPTEWKQSLAQVSAANSIADKHDFKPEEKDALVRIMAAAPGMTPEAVEKFITDNPNGWQAYLNRYDGALAINETLKFSPEDSALVQTAMITHPGLDVTNVIKVINAHPQDWQAQLNTLIKEANAANEANQTSGGAGTPRQKEWVAEVSFDDFKASMANDNSKWVDHQVMVKEAVTAYIGKDQSVTTPAVYETQKGPMTDEQLRAAYIQQYGSPIEKLLGRSENEFVRTTYPYSGKDVLGPAQIEKIVVDKSPLSIGESTGDGRNKDIPHAGNFWDRYEAFPAEIGGVSYKDVDKSLVPFMSNDVYLARQLSDNAKAMGYSFDNKAGDTGAQLGIYLDTIGVKNVNSLFVEDGRIVDKSTGNDLGAYDPNTPFAYTAVGDGWTDFLPKELPNGQVTFIPKWGDSSDAGAIKMVVAVVGACFGVPPIWMLAANTVIDVAAGNPVSLKNIAVGLAASYIGGQVSAGLSGGESIFGAAGDAIINTGSSFIDKALIGGISNAAGSLVTGGDPGQAFLSGAIGSAANSAGNFIAGSINTGLGLNLDPAIIAGAGNFIGNMATNGGNWQQAITGAIRTGVETNNFIEANNNALTSRAYQDPSRQLEGANSSSGTGVALNQAAPPLTLNVDPNANYNFGNYNFGAGSGLFGDPLTTMNGLPYGPGSNGSSGLLGADLFGTNSATGQAVTTLPKTGTGG